MITDLFKEHIGNGINTKKQQRINVKVDNSEVTKLPVLHQRVTRQHCSSEVSIS